jgi:thioester reductase-like protein
VHLEAWVTAGTAPVPAEGERGASATGGPYTEDLASDAFYQRAWHPSFVLGPSFRLVRSARRGPHVAEGTIAVPDGTAAGILAGVRPDLLLLDACVQLVPVAEGPVSADGAVHLGTGYERIVVREPISSGGHRCVAFTRTTADGTLTGDLFVSDGGGRRVAEMYGVSFRAVSDSMLERLVASTERAAPSVPSGPDLAGLRAAGERERARLVLGHLLRLVAAVLGTEPEEIDPGASLTDHLDSLMMAELKDAVERDFEVPLPLERLFEDGRIAALAGLVAAAIKPPLDTPPARSPGASRVPSARLEPLTVAEMTRRAALDGEITAGGDPEPPGTAPGGVLLTGATGFVGAFLLAELLDRMPGPVHCLVRAGDEAHALRRIMENLDDHGVDIGEHRSRVVPVVGDLTEPLLGLSRRDFEGLHAAVGEIVHCGAVVKWTYPYRGLAPANVDGTREVLRLATVGAPRPVHFASTVGVFSSRDYTADLVPETEDLAASGPLAVGYAQTKWVAERMVRTAAERGLPVTIHRINTGGHSVTGAFNRLDHLSMMVKGCVEAGIAPEHAEMPVQPAPVDYVARAMAEACARPDLRGHTFHLVNGRAMSWPEFFDAIEGFGYRLERLPFEEWRARITGRRSGTMALLGLIPFLTEAVDQVRLPASDSARTRAVLEARGVTCPPLETGLVHTYLDAFVRDGFIDPPGRNS